MDKLEFWTLCSANAIVLDKEQVDIFERFHRDLLHWNKQVNLVSRKDEENLWERHIMHSLTLLTSLDIRQKAQCLDVGTGGGFPGIPLKIARPDLRMVLADSISKKMKLTTMFAQHTGLHNISTLNVRVEDLCQEKQYLRFFDVIVARAVAPLVEIIEWTLPLLKVDGKYALLKGGDLNDEILEAKLKYPQLQVTAKPVAIRGMPWFEEQEKKVVVAWFQHS